jgi:hypothetical protein
MKRAILTFICGLSIIILNAQIQNSDLISTSGDYFVSSNISMSWSLGELETETFSTSSVILTQGFQQPVFNITSIKNNSLVTDLNIEVYPNPVSNYLTIKNYNPSVNLTYRLYDIYGKLLISQESNSNDGMYTRINLTDLAQGNYLIQIFGNDKRQSKIYKLIKF